MKDTLKKLIMLQFAAISMQKMESLNLAMAFAPDGTAEYSIEPSFVSTPLAEIAAKGIESIAKGVANGVIDILG